MARDCRSCGAAVAEESVRRGGWQDAPARLRYVAAVNTRLAEDGVCPRLRIACSRVLPGNARRAMRATAWSAPLSAHRRESNSESLAQVVLSALRDEGVQTDVIRLAGHQIDFGVVSEALSGGDEWPAIRERILASEILLMAIPTWLGQPSIVSKVTLPRMDAFLVETREDGATPVAYNRVAGVVVVGNEDQRIT